MLFLKNLLFTVLIPGSVAVWIPWAILSRAGGLPSVSKLNLILTAPLFAAGAGIYLWCLRDFASFGRGTPAPIDPPKHLVLRGLYRYVRNPMYLGVLLVIAGWCVAFQTRALLRYAAAIAVMFHLVVVLLEEPILQRKFGDAFDEYRRSVGRWIPRLPHSRFRDDDPRT